jgi:uncharacterized protein with von Willebrand factor type A (vWA) domain
VLHTYGSNYKCIFVGDASMSPYEISVAGGSVEHMNPESGNVWIQRLKSHFDRFVWLNPTQEKYWRYTRSVEMIEELVDGKMFPLTVGGLDNAIKELKS